MYNYLGLKSLSDEFLKTLVRKVKSYYRAITKIQLISVMQFKMWILFGDGCCNVGNVFINDM